MTAALVEATSSVHLGARALVEPAIERAERRIVTGGAWTRGCRTSDGDDDEYRHEFRAALFGIEAAAHGLRRHRDLLTDQQFEQLAQGLVDEVHRLGAMFDGRVDEAATFDLRDSIGGVIASAGPSGLEVSFHVPSGIEVVGVRHSTAQVVVAVLENVRQHADFSPVVVRVAVLADVVDLFLEDRGPGIPARLRRRVFERGVRGDGSSGSGLGLHVAHRLMAEQGGSIAVCRRRGGGTSFVLRFRRPSP